VCVCVCFVVVVVAMACALGEGRSVSYFRLAEGAARCGAAVARYDCQIQRAKHDGAALP